MRVISKRTLRQFWEKHPNAQPGLLLWYQRIGDLEFQNLNDLRQVFPSADLVSNFIVFNISGNNYRLITYIDYEFQITFVRAVLTHAEYDKENWKNDKWFENS
ncbi:type II toxin-antitoxin system HigB family toxin [Hassallia byssoidea VB512170]|uniref:Type II toxin-antitoxin system HigB family toxin n=1 Tax=Hassallia byssoidea VB512170 TaxID=1304833 RepID=A0A846H0N9_9CYAN|nr:type II toxin-antitoxin system HigB family toxin [Hassalia byssoidea]NEU71322.1 type II toxin-antitoxin system HigB family toxin [Hassalia byssoidea VB512170]